MDPSTSSQSSMDENQEGHIKTGQAESFKLQKFFSQKSIAIIFIALFAGVGVYALLSSHAASPVLTKTWQTSADWTTSSTLSHVVVANNSVALASVAPTNTTGSTTKTTSPATTNIALNKPATSSSNESSRYPASNAVDGKSNTRWASVSYKDPQWIYVNLGATYNITQVKLGWERAYAKAYKVQVSSDAKNWTDIYTTTQGTGGTNNLTNLKGSGRYVRVYGTVRGTQWGYSLWDFQVYGTNTNTTPTPPVTTTYVPSGTILLDFDADAGATSTAKVSWTSIKPQASTPAGTTVTYSYASSADNKTWSAWNSDITKLAQSRYLEIQANLSTTTPTVTPLLQSLVLTYTLQGSTTTPAAPTVNLTASPTSVTSGGTSTLAWSSTNSTSCTASGNWSGAKATSGTVSVNALTAAATYSLACTGAGGTANARVTVNVTAKTTSSNPSGVAAPIGDLSGWKQVFVDDFTVNAPVGSWGTSDAGKVVYKGDHGGSWLEYPDTWPSTFSNGNPGYQPAQVLSVHDNVLDYNLHSINNLPSGANPSPLLPGNTQYQTYGTYTARLKVTYGDSKKLEDYHMAWLLWPTMDNVYQSAESDFPELTLNENGVNAFSHYGGNNAQDAFNETLDVTQWHTYTQVWSPGVRQYYVDGKLIGTTTKQVYSQPERWQLQIEPSGTNNGSAGHVLVDWVAVYSRN